MVRELGRAMPAGAVTADEFACLMPSLPRNTPLAVGVSGGADSLSLLFLLARWCQKKRVVWAVTVDHGRRPEAKQEIAHVENVAKILRVPHVVLSWHGKGDSQAAARRARYELIAQWCRPKKIPALVLAHHLEDQAETFLLRLARGGGADGLAAMSAQSHWEDLLLLRPLLKISRTRLRNTLKAEGITWCEDKSNQDRRFARVRMRQLLKILEKEGLTPEQLGLAADRLRRVRETFGALVSDFMRDHVRETVWGACRVDFRAFKKLPEELGVRVLKRAVCRVRGRSDPMRLERLKTFFWGGSLGTFGGCRFLARKGFLWVVRETGMSVKAPSLHLKGTQDGVWDRRFCVRWEGRKPVEIRALGDFSGDMGRQKIPSWGLGSLPSVWQKDRLVGVPHLRSVPDLHLRLFTQRPVIGDNI